MAKEVDNSLLLSIIDNIRNNIAVVDSDFNIVHVNEYWVRFGEENGIETDFNWVGSNYLQPVEKSANSGDESAHVVLNKFHSIQTNEIDTFELEYECSSPTEERWFSMQVEKIQSNGEVFLLISHRNITKEHDIICLANHDALTGIANRRAFDEFLELEWYRCKRSKFSISLAIIDVDDFKSINDEFGHDSGDDSLKRIADVLLQYTGRASDICARYGGDEFIVVWGNIDPLQARALGNQILTEISKIEIRTADGKASHNLSVSIGVNSIIPPNANIKSFILQADRLLYLAKEQGKRQVVHDTMQLRSDYQNTISGVTQRC